MDQPDLERGCHGRALRGLERINRLSGSAAILWPALYHLGKKLGRPLRILDVATGGGDVPVQLWKRARRHDLEVHIEGCDLRPAAVAFAQAQADQAQAPLRFFILDALHDEIPTTFDALTCSLFLHHLDEDEARVLLGRLKAAARHLVLVNDLRRGVLAWFLAWVGTRLLTRSKVVHVDGPRSVAAAFSREELVVLAGQAGLEAAAVRRRWPFRMLLSWAKSPEE